MRYLGIDYGTKWVGIAVSDERGALAFPRVTLPNDGSLLKSVGDIVRNENVGHIVVGDTRTVGGTSNAVTEQAETFITDLKKILPVPVDTVFEAWSSQEAARYAASGSPHNDAAAAAIILQRSLDMRAHGVQ